MITPTPPKVSINCRRDQRTIDRLQAWAEKKGWRSMAQAQEYTSNIGLDVLDMMETMPADKRTEFANVGDFIDHAESIITHMTDAEKRVIFAHFNVRHDTRYDSKTELQKQLAAKEIEIKRLKGAAAK